MHIIAPQSGSTQSHHSQYSRTHNIQYIHHPPTAVTIPASASAYPPNMNPASYFHLPPHHTTVLPLHHSSSQANALGHHQTMPYLLIQPQPGHAMSFIPQHFPIQQQQPRNNQNPVSNNNNNTVSSSSNEQASSPPQQQQPAQNGSSMNSVSPSTSTTSATPNSVQYTNNNNNSNMNNVNPSNLNQKFANMSLQSGQQIPVVAPAMPHHSHQTQV